MLISGNQVSQQEKMRIALELRKAGKTPTEIAKFLGYKNATPVSALLSKAYASIVPPENIEEIRNLELARLDNLFNSRFDLAIQGDDEALKYCLAIMQRRAKLLGLDKAEQAAIKRIENSDRAQTEKLAESLNAYLAGREDMKEELVKIGTEEINQAEETLN